MNIDNWINRLTYGSPLEEHEVKLLCEKAREILSQEPSLVKVSSPTVVCGDIHGQLADLVLLFQKGGFPDDTSYMFMGDYVDRGQNSVEVISLLLCYKIKYPSTFVLLRGNHETRGLSKVYSFYDECLQKYFNTRVWAMFTDVFDFLPLAGLIDDQVICMHGGLSPGAFTLDDIFKLQRFQEPQKYGAMPHILWSDPGEEDGWKKSSRRGFYAFGPNITKQFLHVNGLNLVSRAHQWQENGYKWHHDKQCLTVFSAPSYCKRANKAAIMRLNGAHCPVLETYHAAIFDPMLLS